MRISLVCSRSALRNHFLFLVLTLKHEIDRKVFPFSSGKMRFSFKFLEKKKHIILRNFEKSTALFWKYQSIKSNKCNFQKFSRELSQSQFSFSSRSPRLKKEVFVLVSKHEIGRKNSVSHDHVDYVDCVDWFDCVDCVNCVAVHCVAVHFWWFS